MTASPTFETSGTTSLTSMRRIPEISNRQVLFSNLVALLNMVSVVLY